MSKFDKPNANIHVIARCLLMQGDQVVICRTKGAEHYFFPGGHVENGENAKDALLRELVEELGLAEYQIGEFIGINENIFDLKDGSKQQEINVVFTATVPDNFEVRAVEDHLEYKLVNKNDLGSTKILPESLKQAMVNWVETGKQFYC